MGKVSLRECVMIKISSQWERNLYAADDSCISCCLFEPYMSVKLKLNFVRDYFA